MSFRVTRRAQFGERMGMVAVVRGISAMGEWAGAHQAAQLDVNDALHLCIIYAYASSYRLCPLSCTLLYFACAISSSVSLLWFLHPSFLSS